MSIPYKNTLEEEDFEEKLIWIKQCRLHYLFSTRRHAHELFQEKEIEFHLFVTRREDVYATKSIQRSSSSGQLGAKQAPPSGLQWESTFSVSLHQLRWLNCATADAGLLDKVDLLVPISTNSMGSMVLKLSIALEFTDFVPLQASSCNYLREKGVFWPPAGYNDGFPLPAAWLALMTPSRRVNDFNQRKDTSATHFNDHITTSPSQRTKQGVLPPPVSSGQRGHRLTIGLETAEASASATDRYLKRHMSNRSINSDRLQEGSSELGSETTSIDADKFDRISSLIPFVSRVFDRQRVVDINGGVRTTTVVNAVSDALSAGIVDTSLLTIDGKPFIQHVGSDLVDAIESLQAAIREMITDDRLPICITWEVFVEKVASYVGVILKKEARERLVKDAHSKLNIAGPMGSNGEEGRSGGILSTTRAIRVSKVLMDISQRLRGTALDVLPGENNIHRYNPADIDMSNLLLLPISRER